MNLFFSASRPRFASSTRGLVLAGLASTLVGLAGCSDSESPAPTPAATDDGPTKTVSLAPRPQEGPRKLVDTATLEGPHPTNLVLDPGFTIGGSSVGYGGFIGLYEATGNLASLDTEQDSRSPAGFTGAVGRVAPDGATDTKSKAILFLAPIIGGPGPFRAEVWVAKTNVDGTATADIDVGTKGISATVTSDPNGGGDAYDLEPADTITAGKQTWLRLRAQISSAIPYGGFFVVRTGTGGGHYLLAAPSVVAASLADEPAPRSLTRTIARRLTDAERRAIARYKAIPPQLTPAPRVGAEIDAKRARLF